MTPFEIAKTHAGLKEVPGDKADPRIAQFFEDVGHPEVKSDEISWCAAFVGSCLERAGLKSTRSLAARSYLKWGEPTDKPEPGDIVVFWRGRKDGWQGHVAFYEGEAGKMIRCFGGNQSNEVRSSLYSRDQLLGFRKVRKPVPVLDAAPKAPDPQTSGNPVVPAAPPGGNFTLRAIFAAWWAALFRRD